MCNSCFVSGSERGRGQRAGGGAGDGPRSHLEEDSRVHVHPTSWKVAFFFYLSNHCVHCCCGHWCEVDKLCDMRHFSYCISIVNALYGAEAQATRRIWRRRNFLYCENWAAAAERWPDRTSLCFNRRSNSQLLTHSHSYMSLWAVSHHVISSPRSQRFNIYKYRQTTGGRMWFQRSCVCWWSSRRHELVDEAGRTTNPTILWE